MNGIVIFSTTNSTKYPGITINYNLSWNQYRDDICCRANRTLGLLRRVLSDGSSDVKTKTNTTLVIGVRAIFCQGGRGEGEPFVQEKLKFSQVAQIFTAVEKKRGPYDALT